MLSLLPFAPCPETRVPVCRVSLAPFGPGSVCDHREDALVLENTLEGLCSSVFARMLTEGLMLSRLD